MHLSKLHVITFHLTYIASCMILYCIQCNGLKVTKISQNSLSPKLYVRFCKWPKTTILCHSCVFSPEFAFSPSNDQKTNPLHKKSYLAYIQRTRNQFEKNRFQKPNPTLQSTESATYCELLTKSWREIRTSPEDLMINSK